MPFDFNINPQSIHSINFRPISTQPAKSTTEAGLFDVNNSQIAGSSCVDSFVKTSFQQNPQTKQTSEFEKTYRQYYNAQKINNLTNDNIQSICAANSINSYVTPRNVTNIDKSHLEKTYQYSMMIANRMGLSQSEKEDLRTASILHDIGKAYIPEEILNKPGRLTDEERKVINSHAQMGGELARQMGANENVVDIIENHHTDNPDNKLCSILQVADRYSALTQQRSYKSPYSPALASKILDKEVEEGKLDGNALNALKQSVGTQGSFYNSMLI